MDYRSVFEQLLNMKLLPNATKQNVLCPFHDDKNPSMTVDFTSGLWHCHACGAGGNIYQLAKRYDKVVDDYGNITDKAEQSVTETETKAKKQHKYEPYTLEDYAFEKNLSVDFLQEKFFVNNSKYSIEMPYKDIDGKHLYNKYRSSNKKMWSDKGITLQPYGLWLLPKADKEAVWIVEGESDTQTLWYNNIPAVGIPGVNAITPDFLTSIMDFKKWVFVIESDKGGFDFIKNIYQVLIDYYYEKLQDSFFVFPSDLNRKDTNDIWSANPNKKQFVNKMQRLYDIKIQTSVAYEDIVHKMKWFDKDIRRVAVALYQDIYAIYDDDDIFYKYNKDKMQYELVKDETRWFRRFMTDKGISKAGKQQQVKMQLEAFIKNKRKPVPVPKEWVLFKNVAVNYKTLETTTKYNSPDYFVTSRIPINYNPNATESRLTDKLFNDWVDNPQDLYETIGYTFIRKYSENKVIILYGVGGNGKTTFLNILENLLNGLDDDKKERNTAHVELKMLLEDRFSRASLYNKYANIAGEMDYGLMNDTTPIKTLTGDGEIDAQFKFGQSFSFLNYAKLIFATNKIPATMDTSKGFFRRMAIIRFKQITQEKKDPLILEKLSVSDYEYIAHKSMLALQNLYKTKFAIAGDEEAMRDLYLMLSNTVRMFISENCIMSDENDYILTTEFTQQINKWITKNKHPKVKQKEIVEELESMGIEKTRVRILNGSQASVFRGLRFKNDDAVSDEIPF